jgi:hypothetical protein
MIVVMTAVLWGQCTNCPFLKAETKPAHGCCPKSQTVPPQNDRCADQDQKLQLYQQADLSKVLPAPAVNPWAGQVEVVSLSEQPFLPSTDTHSALYVLNLSLRI